jgi:peptidyl-prolyl cis-trans isomerase A (cyclophilin A)
MKPSEAVGSLSVASVEALLAEARGGKANALDVLEAFGPRTPPAIEALAALLAEPAARTNVALLLARLGHASRPALPALREAAKVDPALEKAVREVEAARHPALLDPSLATDTAPARFVVRFATTKGDFDVEIHRDWAPIGVDRFWNLVRMGFYDGTRFFRVVPGFVAQFGKAGVPAVDRVWYPATISDDAVKESNKLGYFTFATSGKDARSTQVFVNLADNLNLDAKGFAPIGRVVKGLDVVRNLYDGYGESPDQDRLHYDGDRYLEKNFPLLDRITAATIVE